MAAVRSTVLVTASVAVAGLLAYAVYFDYKRRNDADFRKRLRKEKKSVDKARAKQSDSGSNEVSPEALLTAIEKINKEPIPELALQDNYYKGQIIMGQELSTRGPEYDLESAAHFFKALRAYPVPLELLMAYENTVPPRILKIVLALADMDAKVKIEGYYNVFPPKHMNVSVKTVIDPGETDGRGYLVAAKDFKEGEIIYKEQPVVAALNADLEGKRSHCSLCFRRIQAGQAVAPASDPLSSAYCSEECQSNANRRHHGLLFTTSTYFVVPGLPSPPFESMAVRRQAQETFATYISQKKTASPLLTARLIARQLVASIAESASGTLVQPPDLPQVESNEYTLIDHIDRLIYLETVVPETESNILRNILKHALPGLDSYLTAERHAVMAGRVTHNSYGVCFGDGRDDRPPPPGPSTEQELTRTPYGTSRQVGSAFYLVSSYISHSCVPSARPSFENGDTTLHLVANRPIKQGETITVAYVDVRQGADETATDVRRRRRLQLARWWRFACKCERCVEEGLVDETND